MSTEGQGSVFTLRLPTVPTVPTVHPARGPGLAGAPRHRRPPMPRGTLLAL